MTWQNSFAEAFNQAIQKMAQESVSNNTYMGELENMLSGSPVPPLESLLSSNSYHNDAPKKDEINGGIPMVGSDNFRSEKPAQFTDLVDAIIHQESRGNSNAKSPAGAMGLMQIMPKTWEEWSQKLGIPNADPFNPEHSKQVGTAYIDWLKGKFGGDIPLALASYNFGIGNVLKQLKLAADQGLPRTWDSIAGSVPKETSTYVKNILNSLKA